jgi:hypothetical protein
VIQGDLPGACVSLSGRGKISACRPGLPAFAGNAGKYS